MLSFKSQHFFTVSTQEVLLLKLTILHLYLLERCGYEQRAKFKSTSKHEQCGHLYEDTLYDPIAMASAVEFVTHCLVYKPHRSMIY